MRSVNERTEAYTLIMLTDEYRYRILKLVESNPMLSQRELAKELGVSLGKANFCLKALIDVGMIKATNFRNNKNKSAYMYLLTPSGIEAKAIVTLKFFKRKIEEHDALMREIEELRKDVAKINASTVDVC